jgi:Ca-activated chloride channel family protein
MTKENKNLAKDCVKKLSHHDMTNLSGAISMAIEKAVISDPTKTSRIILLTDGLPTAGVCNKEALIQLAAKTNESVSISTFGYGDDFDAELMASLSKMGRGNNFYIKSDDECNKAFALELGGLLSMFGQNLKLTITPSGNMGFKEMLSEYKCEQKNGYRLLTKSKIEIQIDDIYVGEKKHVLLTLEIPKATEAVCARATRVCDIALSYTDTETKKQETVSETAKLHYVKTDKVASEPNPEVQRQLVLLETVRLQKEAKEKADAGQFKEAQTILAGAVNYINLNASYVPDSGVYASALNEMSSEFSNSTIYRSLGVKSATAYSCSVGTARAGSMDGLSFSNTSTTDLQKNFMKSFAEPVELNCIVPVRGDEPDPDPVN